VPGHECHPCTRVGPPHTVLARLLDGPPQAIRSLRADITTELIAICDKAMSRSERLRYADTLLLAEDLRAYLEHRTVRAYERTNRELLDVAVERPGDYVNTAVEAARIEIGRRGGEHAVRNAAAQEAAIPSHHRRKKSAPLVYRPTRPIPSVTHGIVMLALLILAAIIAAVSEPGLLALLAWMVCSFGSWLALIVFVFRLHKWLDVAADRQYRYSPLRAWLLQAIGLVGMIWPFFWISELRRTLLASGGAGTRFAFLCAAVMIALGQMTFMLTPYPENYMPTDDSVAFVLPFSIFHSVAALLLLAACLIIRTRLQRFVKQGSLPTQDHPQ